MDEFTAVLKARELVVAVNPTTIPVAVEAYASKVGAVIRVKTDLEQDEPGWSFEHGGKRFPPTNPGNAQLQPAMPITAPSITPERFA